MEHKTFEFKVNETPYVLEIGKCAVALFYKNPEVDYLAINMTGEEEDTIRIFNPDMAKWAAGFAPYWDEEDEEWLYAATSWNDKVFRMEMGWSPSTILKDEPFDWEMDRYVLAQTRDIDTDISEFLGRS